MLAVMAIALVAASQLCANGAPAANPFFYALSTVSPAELPAQSSELVSQADVKNRLKTTTNVVRAAVGLNPAAAAPIVGTIAQSTPEMAWVAAATAVMLVPDQATAIARAAAVAAPSETGRIVEAVCRVVPCAYRAVAYAVAGVAPGADRAILAGVAAAIPALQEPINKVLASYNGVNPPVGDVLDQVPLIAMSTCLTSAVTITNTIMSAMHAGPAYISPPTAWVNLNSGNGGEVPTGGHNYANP